jgi:hypothetical protein
VSNYGVGSIRERSDTDSRNDVALEQGRIERQKETRIIEKTNERLKQLVKDDNLYEAMENFLLGDPANQIPQLGEPEEIIAKSKHKVTGGVDLMLRADFETAAKIAIYEQKTELAKDSLELAYNVTSPEDKHARMQRTILEDLSEVMNIASDYYTTKEKITTEEEAAIGSASNKK